METLTLNHCQEYELDLKTPKTGTLNVVAGGSSGDGVVKVASAPSGTPFMLVPAGSGDSYAVTGVTKLYFHYVAEPGKPQTVLVDWEIV